MTGRFKANDIVRPLSWSESAAVILTKDDRWYYVRWIDGSEFVGDSVLWMYNTDLDYEKIGEYEPGAADDIMLYGKTTR